MSSKKDEIIVLKKALTPIHLWTIGVGIVISGNYFGWNFGLSQSGFLGMLIATLFMAIMYLTMTLGISELSTMLPYAGGPYSFARRAMGRYIGFITGVGVVLQYVIAAPIIAIGIGGYISFLFPAVPTVVAAAFMYALFMGVHIMGIKEYATIEMVLVFIALGLLVLMYFVGLPQINVGHLFPENGDLIPGGFKGIWSALPYAMWLFLAIEMLPMLSEETRDVQKDMPKGLISGMVTLLILSILTTTVAIGLAGIDVMTVAEDPLPAAIAAVFGNTYWLAQILASVGLVGLIASFSGVILAYSRQVYALSRAGYLPSMLSKMHKKRQTPYMAIILPGFIGLVLVILFNPDDLILISTFGALVSYITMNLSVLILRKKEPHLVRTFKTPLYPFTPIVSLVLAVIAIFASFFANLTFFIVCLAVFAVATIYYWVWARHHINEDAPEERFAKDTTVQLEVQVPVSPIEAIRE
ncbi:ethanolamine permease [Lysinibacillus sp. YS11]|uniref:ethanolamine permease n=1 Tax=Lysinibacillus TaxID=400634 RepID=UPI000CA2DF1C|nr:MULTISPECIES: ethanolamine permease [Lysinibacillus]AUS86424.1 ethanolamine permease [Lysinibacillus sp. YS11]MBU5251251.1 ethanolamine permease [Lysinibacillus capsici]